MTPRHIPVYDGLDDDSLQRLARDMGSAYVTATASRVSEGGPDEPPEDTVPEIEPFSQLLGIDPAVYRQINAALQAGRQHFMLYGPPGTGKTTFAQYVAGALNERWTLITGSADWSSQDVIGGYQPVGDGKVSFVPGVLLQQFDRPLIIDELNRCDIDKVIGPLFTVLSGQRTTLPYRTNLADPKSPQYEILPKPYPGAEPHHFAPGPQWRLIATINSIDKAALYQMSYALSRRFTWIYLDVPQDLDGFVDALLRAERIVRADAPAITSFPLARIWRAINKVRLIGPAPIIELVRSAQAVSPDVDFIRIPTALDADAYLDAFYMHLLPMLDGILRQEAEEAVEGICIALALAPDDDRRKQLMARLLAAAV
jgi:5-methylcytosine-specific restriction protein B